MSLRYHWAWWLKQNMLVTLLSGYFIPKILHRWSLQRKYVPCDHRVACMKSAEKCWDLRTSCWRLDEVGEFRHRNFQGQKCGLRCVWHGVCELWISEVWKDRTSTHGVTKSRLVEGISAPSQKGRYRNRKATRIWSWTNPTVPYTMLQL